MMETLAHRSLDYVVAFALALVLTLVLTPLVREMNRRLGMVDKPDPRRINKVPIPRGGGLALFIGIVVAYALVVLVSGRPAAIGTESDPAAVFKCVALATAVVAIGYADDKWSLPPKLKLLGQLVVAFLAWWWAGLGFSRLWPQLPAWLDCAMTVFWITGAINAFNLIDGLDGLASGIALIATLGMAGTLFIVDTPQSALLHFAIAGGLLGFLRYNYNPASVFLGDSGSMFIGFMLSVLPLVTQTPKSVLVSVGVPLLAMGVPIFDTALAIMRRSIRHVIARRGAEDAVSDNVMTADSDHLHHRILRSVGLSQRKTAWILYAITAGAVAVGLVAMALKSRTAGLWLGAVTVASVIIFKNMARIELYDAGRLLSAVARDSSPSARRKSARLAIPIYVAFDLALLVATYFLAVKLQGVQMRPSAVRIGLLLRVVATFTALAVARVYMTVWSRAMVSNFVRLGIASFVGAMSSGAVAYFVVPVATPRSVVGVSVIYAFLTFVALSAVRLFRPFVRDFFYAMDCARLKGRKDVSRVLVYGGGLRYRSFRRELVRSTAANERMIVGIIDDDILLRGHYIGGLRVEGTLQESPEIINRLNVDTVVIACVVTDEWMKVVRKTLAPTGVKVTRFGFVEEPVQ